MPKIYEIPPQYITEELKALRKDLNSKKHS